MKFIIGKKLDMTQVWHGDKVVAVTRIQAGPCRVVQIKNKDKDGYEAVQIGFGERKAKNIAKPQKGHMRDLGSFRYLREFRTEGTGLNQGDRIGVGTFAAGDKIEAVGISKGKGFQGVVKRHHFKGAPKSHGTKDQLRMPGSIGSTGPAHVFKGTRMAGRMGGDRVTAKYLEIIGVEPENNLVLVKGSVPGAKNGLILIAGEGELIVESYKVESIKTDEETGEKATSEQVKNKEEKAIESEPVAEEIVEKPADIAPEAETPEQVEKEVIEAKEKVDAK